MYKLHYMAVLDSIGKLKKHVNQLIIAELGSISIFDQLRQIPVFAVFSQQKELVVRLPAVVEPEVHELTYWYFRTSYT